MSIFDIDWNNDGNIDYKDTVIDSLIWKRMTKKKAHFGMMTTMMTIINHNS